MVEIKKWMRLRRRLESRRGELLGLQRSLRDELNELDTAEIEAEEAAQKEAAAKGLNSIESRLFNEIEQIDSALGKMQNNAYGICTSCGREIAFERLEAVPWTDLCGACAKNELPSEEHESIPLTLGDVEGAAELSKLSPRASDEEIRNEILHRVREDGQIESEEIRVRVRDGKVRVEGFVPNVTEHRRLVQLLEEMGVNEIEDRVSEDRLLWERRDRRPGLKDERGKTDEEIAFQGEDVNQDIRESMDQGIPVAPPDTLVSENDPERKG